MPAVARIDDTILTGHGCTPQTTIIGPSENVFVNNRGVERRGDPTKVHSFGGRRCSSVHSAQINAGSSTVFVNNKPLARVNDSVDSGFITSGSPNVFAGG